MLSLLVALTGLVTGASVSLWAQLADEGARVPLGSIALRAAFAALAGAVALPLLRYGVRRALRWVTLHPQTRARYDRWEAGTYAAFALTAFTAVGLQLIVPVVMAIVALFVLAQAALLRPTREGRAPEARVVGALFLLSGGAALIYQVVWQRLLFAAVGVNIEAVTLIVSIFMLGLGIGALVGGRLSLRYADQLPALFAMVELGIAVFGVVSIPLISSVGDLTGAASLPVVALAVTLLLLPPTLLMGATLPILVAHVNRTYADVGRSVGTLYFVNTLGSAAACFATVLVLFAFVGLRTTVYIAVALNVVVAALVNNMLVGRRSAE